MIRSSMNNERERMWEEAVMAQSRYYLDLCLKILRKTTTNPGKDG
jgi:hypothetical protein